MKRHRWLVMGAIFARAGDSGYVQVPDVEEFRLVSADPNSSIPFVGAAGAGGCAGLWRLHYPRVSLERVFTSHQAGASRRRWSRTIYRIYVRRLSWSARRICSTVSCRAAAASHLYVSAGRLRGRTRVRSAGCSGHYCGHAFDQPVGSRIFRIISSFAAPGTSALRPRWLLALVAVAIRIYGPRVADLPTGVRRDFEKLAHAVHEKILAFSHGLDAIAGWERVAGGTVFIRF